MYLNVGEGIALDETCIGLYHAHAKALTFYNPAKPRGKHHCKLYVVCENTHWAAINFKFAHRTYKKSKEDKENEKLEYNNKLASTKKKKELCTKQYDPSDNELEDEDDEDVDDENEKDVPKMVNLVCTLCEMLRGTGVVVNMDNLYSSPEVFIRLKEMGIYARGTFRKNRKYLPSFIQFKKNELKKMSRGCFRFAINKKHHLSCYAWNDKCPVHLLSSADGTYITSTQRRVKATKIDVVCPSVVQRYNEGMQGVDQYNKLLTLFSMANLKWNRYYKKVAMVLLDFAITNAYLHFKMDNNNDDNKHNRSSFMERLQEQMIAMDWSKKARELNMASNFSEDEVLTQKSVKKEDNELFEKELNCGNYSINTNKKLKPLINDASIIQNFCSPVSMKASSKLELIGSIEYPNNYRQEKDLPDSQRSCQICEFEGRGRKRTSVNFCTYHKIRACTAQHPATKKLRYFNHYGTKYHGFRITDTDSWLCPDSHLTCWEKAHNFYIPMGLFHIEDKNDLFEQRQVDFKNFSKINKKSKLFRAKKKSLYKLAYKRDTPTVISQVTKTEDTQVSNLGSPSITKNEDAQVSELGSPSFPETVTSMSMLTQSFMSQPLEIPTINVKVEDDLRNNDIPTVIMKLKND